MKWINIKDKLLLNVCAIALVIILLFVFQATLDSYILRIINLCGIYIIMALGLNLINGFTGQFSLGHAGFMAVGAYTWAILSMPPEIKAMNFYLEPMLPMLSSIHLPFWLSLILAGLVSAGAGLIVGIPTLRLKGDYLAIATLGFSEIIRIVFVQIRPVTNGSLGLKNLPSPDSLMWWIWIAALLTIVFISLLVNSSYGRAFKAIREDETAAQAMGINLFKHKVLSFGISSFLAGIGGALLGSHLTTIDPNMFKFSYTYNILLIVVLGGMGNITGSVVSAVAVTCLMEILRFLDEGFLGLPAIPGLRMVVFSILLMVVILFFPKGIIGNRELSWKNMFGLVSKLKHKEEEVKA